MINPTNAAEPTNGGEMSASAKTIIGSTIFLLSGVAAYFGVASSYARNGYVGWLYALVYVLQIYGGIMVISAYNRPEQKYDRIFYGVLSLFAIAVFFAMLANIYFLRKPAGYYAVSIMLLSFLCLHFEFGRSSEEAGEPATYAKVLWPPFYLAYALNIVFYTTPNNEALSSLIAGIVFLYVIVVGIWLLAFNKPIDKTKRTTTAADGSVTNHVIANDGYYFTALIYLYCMTGPVLAAMLSASAAGGPVVQTIVLQFMSVLYLTCFF